MYLITKYEAGGDLAEYAEARGQEYLPEEQAKQIFLQMAVGIKDIHMEQVVHRDIKHKNIILSNKSETPKVKIADFGWRATSRMTSVSNKRQEHSDTSLLRCS